jgi:hypothetical protein
MVLFPVLDDDMMEMSMFVARRAALRRVVLSHCSQPRDLNGYILSVTNQRDGHFGPLLGKLLLLRVDNLGVAQREKYGGQPVVELLR